MHQPPEATPEWKNGSLVQLQTKWGTWDQEAVGFKFTQLCISPQGHPGHTYWDLLGAGRGHQKHWSGPTSASTLTALLSSPSPWNRKVTSPLNPRFRIKLTYCASGTTIPSVSMWSPSSWWAFAVLSLPGWLLPTSSLESSKETPQWRQTWDCCMALVTNFHAEKSLFHSKPNFLPVWLLMKFPPSKAFKGAEMLSLKGDNKTHKSILKHCFFSKP